MSATAPPFDIRTWLWPGASPATDISTWGIETDISAKVRYPGSDGGAPIAITAGRQDEGSQVDPSVMTLTLDNRSGDFSTENAQGAYYGLLSRNTPIAVGSATGSDSFARTAGSLGTSTSGQAWTTAGAGVTYSTDGSKAVVAIAAANQAGRMTLADAGSADFDITWTTTAGPATTGAAVVSAATQVESPTRTVLFKLNFEPAGSLQASFQRTHDIYGSLTTNVVVLPYSWSAGTRYTCRAQRTGPQIRLKVWRTDSESQPTAWTTWGTESYVQPGDLGLYQWRVAGNTNVGTYTLYVDDFSAIGIDFLGAVVQWPLRWDKSGNNSWAPIQASGVLRRLLAGKGPLKSPLSRQLGFYSPLGWWPFEDDSSATLLASSVNGVRPAVLKGVSPAGDTSLPGASSAATLNVTNGYIASAGMRRIGASETGFAGMFFTKFPNGLPTSRTQIATWNCTGEALITRWVFSMDTTQWYMEGFASDSTSQTVASAALAPLDMSQWVAWQIETEVVGSNTNWAFIQHQVGSVDYYAITGSIPTNIPHVPTGFKIGGSNLPTGTAFSHMWIGPNTLPFVTDSFSLVSSGYAGETASARIARLCMEEGIPAAVEPGTSRAIGVQPQANVITALRNAADADMGILYESGVGIGFRPSGARYNAPVWASLSVAAGQIDDPPEPINDDQRYRNSFTLSRDGGSSATVYDQALINKDGLADDSASVNLATDDVLVDNAAWRLWLAKSSGFRWPGLSLNFGRYPGLTSTWRRRRFAPRLVVTTGKVQVRGAEPDVIAEGFTSAMWPGGWAVGLNCSPAAPWDIGVWGPTTSPDSRYDAVNSTTAGSLTTTATTLLLTSTTVESTWTTDAGSIPYTIVITGEAMTVTAISAYAGTGPYTQTATVVRSVNNVVKTHAAGEAVTLFTPARYGV